MLKVILLEPEIDPPFELLVHEGRSYRELPPLWALSIGTYLKKKIPKTDLTILDCRFFTTGQLKKWAKRIKPDFVGISPKFVSYKNTLRAARIFKKFGAKIVLGGMHASALRKEILTNRGPGSDDYCIDAIIKEDGEKAFYEYVSAKPLLKIKNLIWRRGKEIKENETELLDLSSLPRADRDLVDLGKYFIKNRALTIYSQKGCAWRERSGGCIFCAQPVSGLRFRDPVEVWKEIDFLKKKYDIEAIWDSTENFLNSQDWVREFWRASRIYKNKPEFKIFTRIDQIDDKMAKILRDINVTQAILGVESGSSQSLSAMHKGMGPSLVKKAIKFLNQRGIGTFHCFVLGAPGETEETIDETIKFAKELSRIPGVRGTRFNALVPFPGSLAWQMLLKKTGKKYLGQDIFDWREIVRDWVENFCKIDSRVFGQKIREAKKLSTPRFSNPRKT